MKKTTKFAAALLAAALLSCTTSSPSASVTSSGDKDFDQTAEFALHNINLLKKRAQLSTPSKLLEYMFSTAGSAELTPPSRELEPGLASAYNGPRPAEGIWIQSGEDDFNEFFDRHLLLLANDSKKTITAEAYKADADDPFYRWEWVIE